MVKIKAELYERLKNSAAKNRRPITNELEVLLEVAFSRAPKYDHQKAPKQSTVDRRAVHGIQETINDSTSPKGKKRS